MKIAYLLKSLNSLTEDLSFVLVKVRTAARAISRSQKFLAAETR